MFSIRRPTPDRLRQFADDLCRRPLSYDAGLLDRLNDLPSLPGPLPGWFGDGWFIDRFATTVGHGPDDFLAAREAVRQWAMFDQDWMFPMEPRPPIEVGVDVAYAAQVLGGWWSYGCRILSVIDEPDRFGFVYGTIDGHVERGEELFQIARFDDSTVEFSLVAASRPGRWFAWPGLPIARWAQRRFRPGAATAIRNRMRQVEPRSTSTTTG